MTTLTNPHPEPFVDTPLKATMRRAFDKPTLENIQFVALQSARETLHPILNDVLVLLAGQQHPTPERGYMEDGGWGLALSDLKRAFAEANQLTACKNETANTFMNQVRKLQEQLAVLEQTRPYDCYWSRRALKAEGIIEGLRAVIDQAQCDLQMAQRHGDPEGTHGDVEGVLGFVDSAQDRLLVALGKLHALALAKEPELKREINAREVRPLLPDMAEYYKRSGRLCDMITGFIGAVTGKPSKFSLIVFSEDPAYADAIISHAPKDWSRETIVSRLRTLVDRCEDGLYAASDKREMSPGVGDVPPKCSCPHPAVPVTCMRTAFHNGLHCAALPDDGTGFAKTMEWESPTYTSVVKVHGVPPAPPLEQPEPGTETTATQS